ncbi:MAG: PQQ-binding-like beta-propeller repeat protein [Thermoguttaceae bacterium]
MRRHSLVAAALIAALCPLSPLCAMQGDLISEETAARHGLARPWFAQVELDNTRAGIRSVLLYEGVLYVQTDTGIIHAIDAETGKTLWSKPIGSPQYPSMTPDARADMLAVVNGSRLYVVNRFNGDLLYEKACKYPPGAGAALSSKHVYVPSLEGLLGAYQVEAADATTKKVDKAESELSLPEKPKSEEERRKNVSVKQKAPAPVFCQSFGHATVQPLVTRDDLGGEYVVWPTDRGYLNLGRINRDAENTLGVKYRLQTGATIVARPAYLPPDPKTLGDSGMVFAVSCDGFIYAVQEESGDTLWRFSTGEPIVESPAAIDDSVYVATQLGGMYSLDIKNGNSRWFAENAMRFVAASKTRVYATDGSGHLLVLSAASGARLDSIPTGGISSILANPDTDRIYMVSNNGLIQCFREAEQTEPLLHNAERKAAAKAGLTPPPKKEVEKPKKEHVAPKTPTVPKEHKPKKEPKPKAPREPKQPRRNKKGGGQDLGNPGDQPGGLQGPGKGRVPRLPRNGNGGDNNPF